MCIINNAVHISQRLDITNYVNSVSSFYELLFEEAPSCFLPISVNTLEHKGVEAHMHTMYTNINVVT